MAHRFAGVGVSQGVPAANAGFIFSKTDAEFYRVKTLRYGVLAQGNKKSGVPGAVLMGFWQESIALVSDEFSQHRCIHYWQFPICLPVINAIVAPVYMIYMVQSIPGCRCCRAIAS